MAACFVAVIVKKRKRRREILSRRLIKDLQSPFSLKKSEFIEKFCINQDAVLRLCSLFDPFMKKKQGYPVELQVLSSLRILRTGSYQNEVMQGVAQSTISRNMDLFLDAIMDIKDLIIEFPSYGELAFTEQKFYGQSKIPNILGALISTHVKIHKPSVTNPSLYLNTNNEYSIKIQLVCDSDFLIRDAVVEWPGSTPDYIIWKKSPLRNLLKNNTNPSKSFVVGDKNFPLEPWLLVPYEECHKSEELIFNDHISRALTIVQTCDAMLRKRFKCINHKARPLNYSPDKCNKVIFACLVLHNLCMKQGIPLNEPVDISDSNYITPEAYSELDSDMEELLLRNEASTVRDNIAKHLLQN